MRSPASLAAALSLCLALAASPVRADPGTARPLLPAPAATAAPASAPPAPAATRTPPATPAPATTPAPGPEADIAGQPSARALDAALARLRADPNLGEEHHMRRLRQRPADDQPTSFPAWLGGLAEWLARSFSALLWVAGALAVGVALVWIVRALRARAPPTLDGPAPLVAREELDLRPASLPADIGAAARALLESGEVREALSLLYRGALSRAVHRHGVPIEPSATEGEALEAVRARLDAARSAYIAEVVRLWQSLVYAGSSVPGEAIGRLCGEFAARLDGGTARGEAPA